MITSIEKTEKQLRMVEVKLKHIIDMFWEYLNQIAQSQPHTLCMSRIYTIVHSIATDGKHVINNVNHNICVARLVILGCAPPPHDFDRTAMNADTCRVSCNEISDNIRIIGKQVGQLISTLSSIQHDPEVNQGFADEVSMICMWADENHYIYESMSDVRNNLHYISGKLLLEL